MSNAFARLPEETRRRLAAAIRHIPEKALLGIEDPAVREIAVSVMSRAVHQVIAELEQDYAGPSDDSNSAAVS